MILESYADQLRRWPREGRPVLAQFDADSIVVYQAYRAEIADFAVAHQRFGEGFSLSRMSWIKPNFLWMMYRCGWATKANQERVLALRLRRPFFEELVAAAVSSSVVGGRPDVRVQWDPDHDPCGNPVARRAIQLGLRGDALRRLAPPDLIEVRDVTPFVAEQRVHAARRDWERLMLPREKVFPLQD